MSRALLIVVSGPAGSGKTTLCCSLTGACPQGIRRVITCTTRAPRPGEVDGVDYHFLTREDEMCAFGPDGLDNGRSPDRLDALVWAVTALALGREAGEPKVRRL